MCYILTQTVLDDHGQRRIATSIFLQDVRRTTKTRNSISFPLAQRNCCDGTRNYGIRGRRGDAEDVASRVPPAPNITGNARFRGEVRGRVRASLPLCRQSEHCSLRPISSAFRTGCAYYIRPPLYQTLIISGRLKPHRYMKLGMGCQRSLRESSFPMLINFNGPGVHVRLPVFICHACPPLP